METERRSDVNADSGTGTGCGHSSRGPGSGSSGRGSLRTGQPVQRRSAVNPVRGGIRCGESGTAGTGCGPEGGAVVQPVGVAQRPASGGASSGQPRPAQSVLSLAGRTAGPSRWRIHAGRLSGLRGAAGVRNVCVVAPAPDRGRGRPYARDRHLAGEIAKTRAGSRQCGSNSLTVIRRVPMSIENRHAGRVGSPNTRVGSDCAGGAWRRHNCASPPRLRAHREGRGARVRGIQAAGHVSATGHGQAAQDDPDRAR
jgi:hypothetical protein